MRNFKIDDFSGAGQYLLRMSPQEIIAKENNQTFHGYSNTGFLTTIVKKVSWIINNFNIGDGTQIYALTDMSDGMIIFSNYTSKEPKSNNHEKIIWQGEGKSGVQKMVDWLNNPELSQEHRFATQEEIVRIVMYQSSRWRN
jgi:hypothetical protein